MIKKGKLFSTVMSSLCIGMTVAALLVFPSCAAETEDCTAGASLGKEIEEPASTYARTRVEPGWKQNEKGWWYVDEDGTYPRRAWRQIDGKWYYFASDGYLREDADAHKNTLKGIDVSEWQVEIDWNAVKNDGYDFAIIRGGYSYIDSKTGEYKHVVDKYFDQNMKGANAAGIPVGVYIYSKATNEAQAVADAKFLIEESTGYLVSYPLVTDLEDQSQVNLGKQVLGKIAKAFSDEVKAAGYTPMIYTNENWYKNVVDMSYVSDVEHWVAAYGIEPDESIPRGIWQCCSTGRVKGIKGNVDINFGNKDYTTIVTPRTEPLAGYGKPVVGGEWRLDGGGWWYHCYDGTYPKNEWKEINGLDYWFNAEGYMAIGWQNIENEWYYMNSSGARLSGCWLELGGVWYYLKEDGKMAIGWNYIGNQWYYLDMSGTMLTGWVQLGDSWYYLIPGWGAMATGWNYIGNQWYYLDMSGTMLTGWVQLGDSWYYLIPGWGAMATDWLLLGNTWYYLMATGWNYIGNQWYYLDMSGTMLTGWVQLGDSWYYLIPGWGAMATDWLLLGNTWYYLTPGSGKMVTGTQVINGVEYYFYSDGRCDW